MARHIEDPDVRLIVALAASMKSDYEEDSRSWQESPFKWIKGCASPRRKGAIFESLVAGWCAAKNLNVTRTGDSDADRVIEGLRIEIKGSTLWDAGSYKFQQLRDQNYDAVICLGISPFNVHCWTVPKEEIMDRWKMGDISSQHTGRKGSDTAWIDINPNNVNSWLWQWGGRLSEAYEILVKLANAAR